VTGGSWQLAAGRCQARPYQAQVAEAQLGAGGHVEVAGECVRVERAGRRVRDAAGQGPTLIYFSAQRERFLWDRGCA